MTSNLHKADKIAALFDIKARYLRSANLERDFDDPRSLSGYVPTDHARTAVQRLTVGLQPNSGQRAWRITGDYGSGKSSFALCLASLFGGREAEIPLHIRRLVDFKREGVRPPHLVPILLTGTRERVSVALVKALKRVLESLQTRGPKFSLSKIIEEHLSTPANITDEVALALLCTVRDKIISDGKGEGVLVIIDELGKFLEFACFHPQDQDIYFFQRLAELAHGSKSHPLFVIGLLHQGFSEYAGQLAQSAQREWEKIADRFQEILFNQPLDQIVTLISSALSVKIDQLPRGSKSVCRDDMRDTVDLGWFGFGASKTSLVEQSVGLYPLHPTVLPIMVRVFSRFAQNERSLFSFLLSNEPFGLQWFAQQPQAQTPLYRLCNFYDYVRANFGHRLAHQSYHTHWHLIESMVESFPSDNPFDLGVLKTIGLLNLINSPEFAPTMEAIVLAMAGGDPELTRLTKSTLRRLQGKILYNRGKADGFSLWPYTSVDLEKRYQDAISAIGPVVKVGQAIERYLEVQPIVARRHYIQTGSLRHFDVHYCSISALPSFSDTPPLDVDGRIIVPLCETETERTAAVLFATSLELRDQKQTLVAVPEALSGLAGLVEEVQRWEWIASHTPELNGDRYARDEVARQRKWHHRALAQRLEGFVGLRSLTGRLTLEWYHEGVTVQAPTGRTLLSLLSDICDENYQRSPHIKNELVNRRSLSSAGAAARMRLIERIFEHPGSELLGMDRNKKPPEMSIYLSVLQKAGLHHKGPDGWKITEPRPEADSCHLIPLFEQMLAILTREKDSRVKLSALFDELRRPPFGTREGILPLLFAVFVAAHRNELAFYDNGTFLREMGAEEFRLLGKQLESFEVQYCKIEGMRADLFERLLNFLGAHRAENNGGELLEVVRPLCAMVAQLPPYTHGTKRLSVRTLAVRTAILNARDPVNLLFRDLPTACEITLQDGQDDLDHKNEKFVSALKLALDELRGAFPDLQHRLETQLAEAFKTTKRGPDLREHLSGRAAGLTVYLAEPTLKTFSLRLQDIQLPYTQWLESIASHLTSKPASRWLDRDEEICVGELQRIVGRFLRVESTAFTKRPRASHSPGVRLAVTQADGGEREEVLYFSPEEESELQEIQRELTVAVAKNTRLGLVAASRMVWETLRNKGE